MADYYAVLNRTLSGFGNANAQLRTKLYERARLTIRGQLEGRKPALDDAAMATEMEKLEEAIAKVEKENGNEVSTTGPSTSTEDKPEIKPTPKPELKPEEVAKPEAAPQPEPKPPEPEPEPKQQEPQSVPATADTIEPKPGEVETAKREENVPPIIPLSKPDVPVDEVKDKPADPVREAISEFTEAEETRKAENAAALEEVPDPSDIVEAKLLKDVSIAVDAAAGEKVPHPLEPEPDYSDPATSELDPVSEDETLVIPPAIDAASRRSKAQRISRWVSVVLLVFAIVAALWAFQKPVMIALGLAEDPTRPKPVKTISIKPEPEKSGTETAEEKPPEPAPSVEEPVVPEPKQEERLTENGEVAQPATQNEPLISPQPDVEVTNAEPSSTDQPSGETADSGIQTAILYEKNPLPPSKGLDAGSVRWSVVQEAPATGQPEEPAIRAEIEIPSRNTVLIMTIKRNADPALTASHLIELIFAVPDDFAGGSINTINRIVLKENEQDRGVPLDAVPVKISDGIFLIALDNLPVAQQKNEALLKTRTWIDIPVEYRTGAQALVTIEKGTGGQKVFDEVFAAWAAVKSE